MGAFSFTFKTIIDSNAKLIDNVRVAVNVDPNYYLKGASAEVDYREDYFGVAQLETSSLKLAGDSTYYNDFWLYKP